MDFHGSFVCVRTGSKSHPWAKGQPRFIHHINPAGVQVVWSLNGTLARCQCSAQGWIAKFSSLSILRLFSERGVCMCRCAHAEPLWTHICAWYPGCACYPGTCACTHVLWQPLWPEGGGSCSRRLTCSAVVDQPIGDNIINNQGIACLLQLIPQDKGKCVSSPLGNWDVKIAPFFLVW